MIYIFTVPFARKQLLTSIQKDDASWNTDATVLWNGFYKKKTWN